MSKVFGITAPYENKIDLMMKVIDIHLLLFPPEENLHRLEKEALVYYLLYGYNRETSRDMNNCLSKKIKRSYANSINSTLEKKGFLIKDEYNKHERHLSEQMQAYRDSFESGNRILPILFKQKI